MPTVLLQEIRDLLTAFLTAINTKIEQALSKLDSLKDTADEIKDDVLPLSRTDQNGSEFLLRNKQNIENITSEEFKKKIRKFEKLW